MLEVIIENRHVQVKASTCEPSGGDAVTAGNDHTGKRACEHDGFVAHLSWCGQGLPPCANHGDFLVFPSIASGEDSDPVATALQRLSQPQDHWRLAGAADREVADADHFKCWLFDWQPPAIIEK